MVRTAAAKGEIDAVLAINMSRFGGNIVKSLDFLSTLSKNGVKAISIDGMDLLATPNLHDIKARFEALESRRKKNTVS